MATAANTLRETSKSQNRKLASADAPRLLVTIEQAAISLGISRRQLYELLRSTDLCSVNIGRRRLITMRSLETFVQRLSDEAALEKKRSTSDDAA